MNAMLRKRIEEAAETLINYNLVDLGDLVNQYDLRRMLIEMGVKTLQNQWISVEEALPEFVDGYRSALVIVRSKYNSYDVAKWDEYYKDWITPDYAVANVTHWMPIPEIKGGDE